MAVLALDTSTSYFSVAIERDGRILEEYATACSHSDLNSHNEKLCETIEATLTKANIAISDLSLIVIGEGPGSFTGLRIGYGLARGISFAVNLPIYSYSSFAACAALYADNPKILVCSDARRDELFYALFSGNLESKTLIASKEEVSRIINEESPLVVSLDKEPLPLARGLCALRGILGERIATEPDYIRTVSARTIEERGVLTSK